MRSAAVTMCSLLTLSSCTPILYPRPFLDNQLNPDRIRNEKLIYSEDLHGVAVEPSYFSEHERTKGHEAAVADLRPVHDESGRKFQSLEAIGERMNVEGQRRRDTVGQNITGAIGSLVAAPFLLTGFIVLIAGGAVMAPYLVWKTDAQRQKSFNEFKSGVQAMSDGNATQAKQSFEKALAWEPKLAQDSNIYFLLAQANEKAGNSAEAAENYRRFIEYSSRLYPDHFQRGDDFKNSFEELKKDFGEADARLKILAEPKRS